MAPAIGSLVHETSITAGTGDLTLVKVNGKQTFNTVFDVAGTDKFYYFVSNATSDEWEYGTGHMSSSTVLVRDTVSASSNADSLVSFTADTKDVTNDIPAEFQGDLNHAVMSALIFG